jgi:hypothetical protein
LMKSHFLLYWSAKNHTLGINFTSSSASISFTASVALVNKFCSHHDDDRDCCKVF